MASQFSFMNILDFVKKNLPQRTWLEFLDRICDFDFPWFAGKARQRRRPPRQGRPRWPKAGISPAPLLLPRTEKVKSQINNNQKRPWWPKKEDKSLASLPNSTTAKSKVKQKRNGRLCPALPLLWLKSVKNEISGQALIAKSCHKVQPPRGILICHTEKLKVKNHTEALVAKSWHRL